MLSNLLSKWLFKYLSKIFLFFALIFFITACSSVSSGADNHKKFSSAPVINGWNSSCASSVYRVQPKESLYTIAFKYNLDAEKLAQINQLSPPYHVKTGQSIKLRAEDTKPDIKTPEKAPEKNSFIKPQNKINSAKNPPKKISQSKIILDKNVNLNLKWIWPTKGNIIQNFDNNYGGNKGINIAGEAGQAVKAAASGQVVYCGSGLKGYGLLIIIKHNSKYLSAYAHNKKALVKEGQKVKQGQVIAEMGKSDSSNIMLHFEIRQAGVPVDPLRFLPKR